MAAATCSKGIPGAQGVLAALGKAQCGWQRHGAGGLGNRRKGIPGRRAGQVLGGSRLQMMDKALALDVGPSLLSLTMNYSVPIWAEPLFFFFCSVKAKQNGTSKNCLGL